MTIYDDDGRTSNANLTGAGIVGLHEYATALIRSVEDLFEGTPAQRIGKLITDENGLQMTSASRYVLGSVLVAVDRTDERWGEHDLPGTPSVTDYAASVISHLQKRYSTPGVGATVSYTGTDMVAAAEAHYRAAAYMLEDTGDDFESTAEWKAVRAAEAHAEAAAGLLAMKLARYAFEPNRVLE